MIARVDVASYNAGLKQARNMIVLKYGGVMKRPGTRLVAEVFDATKPVRLIPFQFSLTQAYALELGQGYMRPAAFGGMVLEAPLRITAITKASAALVTVAYHAYAVNDQIYFLNVLGMTQINGITGKVKSVPSVNTFTVDINTSNFSTFTGDNGGTARTAPPPPPPVVVVPPPVVPPPAPPPIAPPSGSGGSGDSGGTTTPPTSPISGGGGGFGSGGLGDGGLINMP